MKKIIFSRKGAKLAKKNLCGLGESHYENLIHL